MRLGRAEISAGFFLTLAALLYFDTENLLIYAVAAAVWHEAAHMLAIRAMGGEIERIRLTAVGAEIRLAGTYGIHYLGETLIYIAGPLANFTMAIAASLLGNAISSEEVLAFGGLNYVLGIFNIMPIKMLDGGNALRSVSMHFFGRVVPAVQLLHVFTVIALLIAGFLFMRLYGFNLTMLFVLLYLVLSGVIEHRPVFRGLSNDLK